MPRYNQKPNFKVKVNYPAPENYSEYQRRKANVVAKILIDTLPPDIIEKIITKLNYSKRNNYV
ncbi:hypothetical protein [Clostridium botulinum]|uniref:4-alpha-glucanotransferase n=1 Tax=Clostridium botulinum TaxID=1491 RepID=A0A9Q1UY73_CLOBO|nr:hypothetical protein [Clostridium botulinum]AEB75977.1 hypothetical protein CbC4_1297 [Clostridium botulinum BKT015925]KEI00534.1 4-alpha-glucanotransferase [Clostridium botulinum D str. 16868]KEI01359.1 4-alpha-glucanotransferase [Clostridium botulinum C/D str. Sp77]KLU76802.1 4-alpha-glucanotransferase [Clostridium botulinum V891]KOA73482.1 4-alpha-glucanotransferase [Clostridium botulinum]